MTLCDLSAADLDARVIALLAKGREIEVEFLLHLGEVDRRRSYERHGYPSLWQYCVKHLRLGEGQAFRRTNAARILQRFPFAADYLRDGRLCMTKLVYFKDVLTDDNARRLLDRAVGKSQEEVERLAEAEKQPTPLPPSTIRARPTPSPELLSFDAATVPAETAPAADSLVTAMAVPSQTPPSAQRVEIKPHGAEAFILRVAASAALVEKIKKARAILSHTIPTGDIAAVIERVVDEFLAVEEKLHGVAGLNKRAQRPCNGISAETERQLWIRDGGQCAWPMPDGSVCGSTWQLEPHHVLALALGGTNELANLLLTCRAHNQRHARETFGAKYVDEKIRERRGE